MRSAMAQPMRTSPPPRCVRSDTDSCAGPAATPVSGTAISQSIGQGISHGIGQAAGPGHGQSYGPGHGPNHGSESNEDCRYNDGDWPAMREPGRWHDDMFRLQPGMPVHRAVPVFVGLQAIGKAVGAGPQTIKRWIREESFPARRCSDGIYRASAESLLAWFKPPFPGCRDERLAGSKAGRRTAHSGEGPVQWQ
ncbi:MAG: hypothetical protein ACK5JO_01585 [Halodesulfovibrio sp.]